MAAGQTVVTYNGVTIVNCLTRRFEQEPIYDESGTDLQYYKYTVRVVGHVHGDTSISNVTMQPNPGSGDAANHFKAVRYLLGAPRGAFAMKFGVSSNLTGGSIVLQCNPPYGPDLSNLTNADLNNGPKPRVVELTMIAANQLLQVEFEIEICKMECDAVGSCPNSSGVLNHRWTCTDDVDQNFYTTRTFHGRLRTATSRLNPNSFRSYVVPPLQPGMRRDSMQFLVQADGLVLEYTIIDKEVAFSPPAPATTWHFRHSERVERTGETGFFSTVQITLGGDRDVDKKKLISIAAAIAQAKLLTKANKAGSLLHSIEVTDEYSDNASLIHLTATAQRMPDETGGTGAIFGLQVARLGRPISQEDLKEVVQNYDRNKSRGGRAGEKLEVSGPVSIVGAFSSYLQTPCNNIHGIYTSEPSQSSADGTPGPTTEVKAYTTSELPDDRSLSHYNYSSRAGIYTYFQMESTYDSDRMKVQCPIAADASPSSTTNVVITLAGSIPQRIVRIKGERAGSWPVFPLAQDSFTESGITYTLLNDTDRYGVPERSATGEKIYRAEREFVYAMSRRPMPGEEVRVGVNPWETTGLYRLAFNGSDNVPEESYPVP